MKTVKAIVHIFIVIGMLYVCSSCTERKEGESGNSTTEKAKANKKIQFPKNPLHADLFLSLFQTTDIENISSNTLIPVEGVTALAGDGHSLSPKGLSYSYEMHGDCNPGRLGSSDRITTWISPNTRGLIIKVVKFFKSPSSKRERASDEAEYTILLLSEDMEPIATADINTKSSDMNDPQILLPFGSYRPEPGSQLQIIIREKLADCGVTIPVQIEGKDLVYYVVKNGIQIAVPLQTEGKKHK